MGILNDLLTVYDFIRSIQSIAYFLIPLVLYPLQRWYRSAAKSNPRPLQPEVLVLIGVLGIAGAIQLLLVLNHTPRNVFVDTRSTIKTSGEIIASRLAALSNSSGSEDPQIDKWIQRLSSQAGRKLYSLHGPAVEHCEWCSTTDPKSFAIFNLPGVLLAYGCNCLAVLISTVAYKRNCRQWRFMAVGTMVAMLAYEVYQSTMRPLESIGLYDTDIYWSTQYKRAGSLTLLNAALAVLIWLSSTGRLFDIGELPQGVVLARAAQKLSVARMKQTTANMMSSAVSSDRELREFYSEFQRAKYAEHQEILNTPEVKEAYQDVVLGLQGHTITQQCSDLVEKFY